MKVVGVILIAVLGFAAGLVAFMPATLVDRELNAATGGKLRFADATGTLWDGRGVLMAPGSAWRAPLAFSIAPADVVRGMRQVALHPVDGGTTPRGVIDVTRDGIRLRDVAIDVPAAALLTALPTRGLAVVGGTLSATSGVFIWSAADKSGSIEARWRGARLVVADTVADLGNVDLALSPRDGRLNGRLTNTGGDVRIDGTIVGADTGAVSVDATVTPSPSAPANVARALAAIGSPDASGAVHLAWRGTLR